MNKKKMLKNIKYSLRFLPDKLYLQLYYFMQFHKFIDFKNPKTFNEKLNWLKLHDRNPIYTKMVDKYEVKQHVSNIIGEEYIIPTLGVWDKFDEINFDELPNQFVLKCTHDSAGLVIVKDKNNFDKENAKKTIEEAMKCNFYYIGREYPYKNVKPRIIAEKYMEDESGYELKDYKIFCFNGKAKMVLICKNRFSKEGLSEDFFDTDWNHLDIRRPNHSNSSTKISKPKCLDEMCFLAERLSKDISFIRVDFYEVSGKVYFGELTFFPAGGFEGFIPESRDEQLGSYIKI